MPDKYRLNNDQRVFESPEDRVLQKEVLYMTKLRGHGEHPAHWVDFLSIKLEVCEPCSLWRLSRSHCQW